MKNRIESMTFADFTPAEQARVDRWNQYRDIGYEEGRVGVTPIKFDENTKTDDQRDAQSGYEEGHGRGTTERIGEELGN